MNAEQLFAGSSIAVSLLALGFSSFLLTRQNKQIEHERNANAILDAIGRLTAPEIVAAFTQLESIGDRYPDDDSVRRNFDGSDDDHALVLVAQYVETVACLARRRVLDASLIVDAVGFMLRSRWSSILPFVERLRRIRGNAVSLRKLRVVGDVQHVVERHASAARRPELRSQTVRRGQVQGVRPAAPSFW